MCFDGGNTLKTKTVVKDDLVCYEESPPSGKSWRRRYGLGGSYYPSQYYARAPTRHCHSGAMTYPARYPQYGGYSRGVISGGQLNGHGYPNQHLPRARALLPHRSYYTSMPTYGYQHHQAYVYPPGPSTSSTTTTTYHVTNSHAPSAPPVMHEPRITTSAHHPPTTREDIQLENRRVATERGAYHPRRIKPADARHDDPFWCRERNGEWHLRTFYQIENECHPGRWLMDAEVGFLVFHRE